MTSRYKQLAAQFARGIEAGIYAEGDKLPGIRHASRDHGLSPATVVAAYRQLELEGYLEAKPRSGFFVLGSPAAKYAQASTEAEAKSKPSVTQLPVTVSSQRAVLDLIQNAWEPDSCNLASAVPHPSFLPQRAVENSLRQIARLERQHIGNYAQPKGEPRLREQLAKKMTGIGCFARAEDIVVTNGCQEAIIIALRVLTSPGDVIVLEAPTYHGHLQAAESLGLKVLEIPARAGEGIALEALQLALEQWPVKACLIVANYSNPLGVTLSPARKERLIQTLEQYRVPLIEDDIYGDLSFSGQRPPPLKSLDRTGSTLYCSSFSKSLSPGLRLGWMLPGRFLEQALYQKFITSVATNTMSQLVVADLLANGQYHRHVKSLRKLLANSMIEIRNSLLENLPAGSAITEPDGGYVLWVELPSTVNAQCLSDKAREADISIAPGLLFSVSGKFANCMRISCALPWTESLDQAIRQLGALATALQSKGSSE